MNITKVDGTRRKYVFENGQEVDFANKALYAQLKRQNMNNFLQRPDTTPIIAQEAKIIVPEEPKVKKSVSIKRPLAKWEGK